MCELWGAKLSQKKQADTNITKNHAVFFQLLSMARVAHRSRLKSWAMIQSISSFSRGVDSVTENAFAFFGNLIFAFTRMQMMTGWRDAANKKLQQLLAGKKALIFVYDNFQQGIQLLFQCEGHSAAFFHGTNICTHQMIPFVNTIWDAYCMDYTLINQACPSPLGMPWFHKFDFASIGDFFIDYDSFETPTHPDFLERMLIDTSNDEILPPS